MSGLALVVVMLAVGAATAWLCAAVLLPTFTLLSRRFPALARWSLVVAVLPPLAAVVIAVAAVLPGDLVQLVGCHCGTAMPSWLHLCPVHPTEAAAVLPLAVAVLALWLPGRLRAWAVLAREPLGPGGTTPTVVDLPARTALLLGWLNPSVVVDRQLWRELSSEQRAAVLAHERAHLSRSDPAVLMALRLLVSVGPARAGAAFARAWLDRAEAQADAVAARHVGSAIAVADALVRCARLGTPAPLAVHWTGGRVEQRVHALLHPSGSVGSDRPDVGWVDAALLSVVVAGSVSAVPWLHHQVEHLLIWTQ